MDLHQLELDIIYLKYFTDDLPGEPRGGPELVTGGERGEGDQLSGSS